MNSNIPTVDSVRTISGKGPWDTKSGGKLEVLFEFSAEFVQEEYFNYNQEELDNLPTDIRGFRAYSVRNLGRGKIGAHEWHKLRTEFVFALDGSAEWECEDLKGGKKVFTLKSGMGVCNPPFILHTYKALGDNVRLLVLANTMFDTNDAKTQDIYSAEAFHELQAQYRDNS